jgi:hypothetical protein
VSVGWLARSIGNFTKAKDCSFAVAHNTKDERGDMALQKQHGSSEFNSLFEELVIRSGACPEQNDSYGHEGEKTLWCTK